MEIDPTKIDINIHPSKTEVKFEEDSIVFEILNASVRESLGINTLATSIDFNMEGAPEIPIPNKSGVYTPPPKIDFNPLFNPFDSNPLPTGYNGHQTLSPTVGNTQSTPSAYRGFHKDDNEGKVDGYGELFEERMVDKKLSDSRSFLQIQGKYLLTTVKSGLLLIHIRRSRERILYERYLSAMDDYTPLAQESLFPTVIEYDTISYSFLEEAKDILPKLGFSVDFSEPSTITVKGLPEGYSTDIPSVRTSIDELISIISEYGKEALTKADVRHNIAASLAKSGAKGAIASFSALEAQILIDSLFGCAEPDTTPDGRACMSIITVDDLNKML